MALKKIKLDLDHFARLTHRSREDARLLVQKKASQGLWQFEGGGNSEAFVELPSSELYQELEAAAGVSLSDNHHGSEDSTSACPSPDEELHHLKHENENLRAVLEGSGKLLEEIKENMTEQGASSDTSNSHNDQLATSLSETKIELIRAYDRIIDLQRQLVDIQQANLTRSEESKALSELAALLARCDAAKMKETGDS